MKTNNHSEIGWHMILGAIVFLMLVPIVFALSNSFKTLQDAFNTIFEIIPACLPPIPLSILITKENSFSTLSC